MQKFRLDRFSFLPLLILVGLILAACSSTPAAPTSMPPRTTQSTGSDYPAPLSTQPAPTRSNSEYPLPTPFVFPTPNPYPYPYPGPAGAAQTPQVMAWQRVELAEAGLALDIPAEWRRVEGDEILWEISPGSPARVGVHYGQLAPGQMIEAAFLPPNSQVQGMTEVPVATGMGQLFTVQVMDPSAGGAVTALEQHLLFRTLDGRGYDLFLSAPDETELNRLQLIFEHIRNSIFISN